MQRLKALVTPEWLEYLDRKLLVSRHVFLKVWLLITLLPKGLEHLVKTLIISRTDFLDNINGLCFHSGRIKYLNETQFISTMLVS